MTPLEALRAVCVALEAGEAAPAAAAAIVSKGLRQYLNGAGDLPISLGLRPRRGQRSQLTRERKAQRDEHIRAIFARQNGEKTDRARKTAALLASPLTPGEVTEADVMAHLIKLQSEHGSELPRSWSQVLRLVGKD